jgi:hypothetical protein
LRFVPRCCVDGLTDVASAFLQGLGADGASAFVWGATLADRAGARLVVAIMADRAGARLDDIAAGRAGARWEGAGTAD